AVPARWEVRAGTFAGPLAGVGGCLGLFRAGAVLLWLALARSAVVAGLARTGPGLGGRFAGAVGGLPRGAGGDFGFDAGQRVTGVQGLRSRVRTGGVWVPGGPPGLQNRWTARRVVGGFDSRPPPPPARAGGAMKGARDVQGHHDATASD